MGSQDSEESFALWIFGGISCSCSCLRIFILCQVEWHSADFSHVHRQSCMVLGVPVMAKWFNEPDQYQVQSLALLSGLRIQCCCEVCYRSQTWLGSCAAVAKSGSYSSDSTPSLGTSICSGCGPKKAKDKYKVEWSFLPVTIKYREDKGILEALEGAVRMLWALSMRGLQSPTVPSILAFGELEMRTALDEHQHWHEISTHHCVDLAIGHNERTLCVRKDGPLW